jgi:hypothetical protein
MAQLIEKIETRLGREEAFEYIADFANQAEWDPNTVTSRRVDEADLGVGSRFALEVKAGPKVLPMEYRITQFDPPNRFVLIGEGSGVWTEDRISFVETPQGTRIEYDVELRVSGVLSLLQPLLGRYLRGLAAGIHEGMKRELDALAAAGTEGREA